jgi:glycosyltransferase involved in cell wall biosynthesis
MKESLRRQAEQWKLTNRLQIPGYLSRDAVENIRKDAVAQVVPSIWYENAPSTAVEALSLGVPVIASDIGGLPEMVTADSGSETFPAGDVHELADLLVRFWDERNKLEARRGKARTTYETKFRPEIHIAEYLNTIKAM